ALSPFDIQLTGRGNAAPVLAMPTSPLLAEGNGSVVLHFAVSATDAEDGALATEASPPSGSSFPPADTVVTVTSAPDSGGRFATGSFVVRVLPMAPPTLTL